MTLIKWYLPKYSKSRASQLSMPPLTGGQVGDPHIPPAQLLSLLLHLPHGRLLLLDKINISFLYILSNCNTTNLKKRGFPKYSMSRASQPSMPPLTGG